MRSVTRRVMIIGIFFLFFFLNNTYYKLANKIDQCFAYHSSCALDRELSEEGNKETFTSPAFIFQATFGFQLF